MHSHHDFSATPCFTLLSSTIPLFPSFITPISTLLSPPYQSPRHPFHLTNDFALNYGKQLHRVSQAFCRL